MKTYELPLSKAQEKELFADIVSNCPNGYVKDILSDMRLDVERAITSDFGFVSFKDRLDEIQKHRETMQESHKLRDELKEQIRTLEWRKHTLETGLTELRKTISKLGTL